MNDLSIFIDNFVRFIINPLIGLLMALAVVYFLWGAAQLVLNGGSEEGRKKGKDALLWGLIGLFIMVAVFGILRVVVGTFVPEAVTF
ncbi:MAG: hypothetical protein ACJKTH_02370 [Patescibacteria group bacterium UBA2163]